MRLIPGTAAFSQSGFPIRMDLCAKCTAILAGLSAKITGSRVLTVIWDRAASVKLRGLTLTPTAREIKATVGGLDTVGEYLGSISFVLRTLFP